MHKKIAWILMIPICIIALYFLLESVMYVPEITGMEGTGLVLFIPIFAIICIGNIVVHIIVNIIPLTNTAPKASCQLSPIEFTIV